MKNKFSWNKLFPDNIYIALIKTIFLLTTVLIVGNILA